MPIKLPFNPSNRSASGHKGNSKSHAQNTSKGENFAITAMSHLLEHQELKVYVPLLQRCEKIILQVDGRNTTFEELLQVNPDQVGATLFFIGIHLQGRSIKKGTNCMDVSEQVEFLNQLVECENPPMKEKICQTVTSRNGDKYQMTILQPISSWDPQSSKKKSENTKFKKFTPQFDGPQFDEGQSQFTSFRPQYTDVQSQFNPNSFVAKALLPSQILGQSATTAPAKSGDDFGRIAKTIEATVLRTVEARLQEHDEIIQADINSRFQKLENYTRGANKAYEGQMQAILQKTREGVIAMSSSQIDEVWQTLSGMQEEIKKLTLQILELGETPKHYVPEIQNLVIQNQDRDQVLKTTHTNANAWSSPNMLKTDDTSVDLPELDGEHTVLDGEHTDSAVGAMLTGHIFSNDGDDSD